MNRSDIRTRILEALNESASNPVFWSSAQINDIINEAAEVLAEEASSVKRTALTALRPGTIFYYTYGIADDMMVPYRLWLPDEDIRLTVASLREVDDHHEQWMTVTGKPRWWIPISWNLFGLYPHPGEGGGTLRVDYLAWPRAMDYDSDEPEYQDADHDALVLYGVYDGLMKQWNVQRGLQIFSLFVDRWVDAMARNEVKRIASREFQRARQEVGWGH